MSSVDSMRGVTPGPFEGFGGFVVVADVAHEFSAQIVERGEDASGDKIALNLGEPEFDLSEPRGVSRREVQPDARIAGAMSNAYLPDTLATFHEQLRAA